MTRNKCILSILGSVSSNQHSLLTLAAVMAWVAAPSLAQINLGTAESFAVLGGSTVTNTGSTVVTGNLGVSPGTAITGFGPGIVIGGTIHAGDALAASAQADALNAYNTMSVIARTSTMTGTDLGGLTLTPGIYFFESSAQLTGTLTLDGLGQTDPLFIFQIGSTLTTASASSIVLLNNASACDVFFQVGSSATLGTSTAFQGTIVAMASNTLNTGASVIGHVISLNGAVTMDSNNVTACTVPAPSVVMSAMPLLLIATVRRRK